MKQVMAGACAVLIALAGSSNEVRADESATPLARFAECAMSEYLPLSEEFLAKDAKENKQQGEVRKFIAAVDACKDALRTEIISYSLLRAELAATAFRTDTQLRDRISKLSVTVPNANLDIRPSKKSRMALTIEYAVCLSKSDPNASLHFVLAERGSEVESNAVSEIEGFVDCMPHMSLMNVSLHSLKDQLAVQLYKRASNSDV